MDVEIRKLPLFEQVSIPAASLKLWKERYDNYREDMTDALSSNSQSERNLAGDVINKYKEVRILSTKTYSVICYVTNQLWITAKLYLLSLIDFVWNCRLQSNNKEHERY